METTAGSGSSSLGKKGAAAIATMQGAGDQGTTGGGASAKSKKKSKVVAGVSDAGDDSEVEVGAAAGGGGREGQEGADEDAAAVADALAAKKETIKAARKMEQRNVLLRKKGAKTNKMRTKNKRKMTHTSAAGSSQGKRGIGVARVAVGTRGFMDDSSDDDEDKSKGPIATVTAPKPKPAGLAEFEARLLEIAVRSTARAALKLREKSQLTDESFSCVRELTHAVKGLACRMDAEDALHLTIDEAREFQAEAWWKDRPKRLLQPELKLSGPVTSKAVGFHGLDHLADLRDTSIFRGHDTSTGAEPFPNLLEGPQPARMPDGRPAFPGKFRDIRGVVERAVTHCRGIFSRGNSVAPEAVGVDVVSMFEELFLERLPCPFPWHEVVDSRARHRGGP